MGKASDLINEIRVLMRGTDHSNSPKLRKYYEEYLKYTRGLCEELDKCREMIDRNGVTEARRYNNSQKPTLLERVATLDFAERQEFIDLCQDYGMPAMPTYDKKLLEQLRGPLKQEDLNYDNLMRDWRRIARTGSSREKIELLHKLIKSSPAGGVMDWRKNLAVEERKRDGEIEAALSRHWTLENLTDLEAMQLELNSPDRVSTARPELIDALESKLRPLQQEHTDKLVEEKLNEMLDLCARNDDALLDKLQSCHDEWEKFRTNPLVNLNDNQLANLAIVEEYINTEVEKTAKQAEYDEIIAELKRLITENDGAEKFVEIKNSYDRLCLLDMPIDETLSEKVRDREIAYNEEQVRMNHRRVVYAISAVIGLFGVIAVTIVVVAHIRAVNNTCKNYAALMKSGDYQTVITKYQELERQSPRIAGDAKVKAKYHEAVSMGNAYSQNQKLALATLERNRKSILAMAKTDLESGKIDTDIAEIEKFSSYLVPEKLAEFQQLKTDITLKRHELLESQIRNFKNKFDEIIAKLESVKNNLPVAVNIMEEGAKIDMLDSQYSELKAKASKKVLERVEKESEFLYKTKKSEIDYLYKQETKFREVKAQLCRPANASVFFDGLRNVIEYPELAKIYANASSVIKVESNKYTIEAAKFARENSIADIMSGKIQMKKEWLPTPIGKDINFCSAGKISFDLSNFLDNVIDNFDYYELAMTDRSGRVMLFYCKNEPNSQKKQGFEFINKMYFDAQMEQGKKPIRINLSWRGFNGVRTATIETIGATGLPELAVGKEFVKVEGMDLRNGNCEKNELYNIAKKYRSRTITPDNTADILMEMLLEVCGSKVRNPIMQLEVIRSMLTAINQLSPFYAQLTEQKLATVNAMVKKIRAQHISWMAYMQPRNIDEIKSAVAQVNPMEIVTKKKAVDKIYFELLSRGFSVGGVVDMELKPHFFGTTPAEYFVIRDSENIHLIQSDLANGKILDIEKPLIYPGQLLWYFADGKKCADFVKKDNSGKLPRRPALWPENVYMEGF